MKLLPTIATLALFATITVTSDADAFGGGGGKKSSGGAPSVAATTSPIVVPPPGPVSAPEPSVLMAAGLGLLGLSYLLRRLP